MIITKGVPDRMTESEDSAAFYWLSRSPFLPELGMGQWEQATQTALRKLKQSLAETNQNHSWNRSTSTILPTAPEMTQVHIMKGKGTPISFGPKEVNMDGLGGSGTGTTSHPEQSGRLIFPQISFPSVPRYGRQGIWGWKLLPVKSYKPT